MAVRGRGWVLSEVGPLPWIALTAITSALCGLPFLFLLCGIVAALRLLAVGCVVSYLGVRVDGLGMFGVLVLM